MYGINELRHVSPFNFPPKEGLDFHTPTQTTLREHIYREISAQLSHGSTLKGEDLLKTFHTYSNTLLTHDFPRIHQALEKKHAHPLPRPEGKDLDVAGEFSYAIARLIDSSDFNFFSEAEIHLTDNHVEFMQQSNLKRASGRGRLYFTHIDRNGKKHLTYLIRRPDNNETPTDTLELLSLLSVVELAKHKIRRKTRLDSSGQVKGYKGRSYTTTSRGQIKKISPYKDELSKFTSRNWSYLDLARWVNTSHLKLTQGELSLSSLNVTPNLSETASYYSVSQIQEQLHHLGITADGAILGNDFTFTLTIATGVLTPQDLTVLSADQQMPDPLDSLNGTIKPDKLKTEEQDLVRRFGYLQYLNRYHGDNANYQVIRDKIRTLYEQFQIPLLKAVETPLADNISLLDFSQISDEIIANIPVESVRNLVTLAKQQNRKLLNFCYPLGDNTYSLVKSLHQILEIVQIGFFGKVGATLDYLDDENCYSGAQVGRIVLPERSAVNSGQTMFEPVINQLTASDIQIIQTADETEVILQVNGVLLQTLEDIKVLRDQIMRGEVIIEDAQGYPINPKKIKILLDMESAHLRRACEELDIAPFICYYTSDNTKVPPINIDRNHQETIVTTLGERGSLAVLLSGLSVLHGIVNYPNH